MIGGLSGGKHGEGRLTGRRPYVIIPTIISLMRSRWLPAILWNKEVVLMDISLSKRTLALPPNRMG